MKLPMWTIVTNLASSEDIKWVGMSWEFFDELSDAERCFQRHSKLGNVPTLRRFNKKADYNQLGAIHRYEISKHESQNKD